MPSKIVSDKRHEHGARGIAGARQDKQSAVAAALALSMLLASLGTSIANIALPSLTEAFSASFGQVQWDPSHQGRPVTSPRLAWSRG